MERPRIGGEPSGRETPPGRRVGPGDDALRENAIGGAWTPDAARGFTAAQPATARQLDEAIGLRPRVTARGKLGKYGSCLSTSAVPTVSPKRPRVNSPASFGASPIVATCAGSTPSSREQLQQRRPLVRDRLGQVHMNIRPDQVHPKRLGRGRAAAAARPRRDPSRSYAMSPSRQ
jgi:hypothetical protein